MPRIGGKDQSWASPVAGEGERIATYQWVANLVVKRVRKTRRIPHIVTTEDLQAAAAIGLLKAARTCAKPEKFISYAYSCVLYAILDELRAEDWTTRAAARAGARWQRVKPKALLGSYELGPEFWLALDVARIGKVLARLSAREQRILRAILSGVSQKDLAARLGVSEPRVTQLVSQATSRLQRQLGAMGEEPDDPKGA
jgi:RNA polymerase sigma factor (sigma-70 family)